MIYSLLWVISKVATWLLHLVWCNPKMQRYEISFSTIYVHLLTVFKMWNRKCKRCWNLLTTAIWFLQIIVGPRRKVQWVCVIYSCTRYGLPSWKGGHTSGPQTSQHYGKYENIKFKKTTYGSFHIKVMYHSQFHLTLKLEKEIRYFPIQSTCKVGEGT